jgi:hypothetical protein
MHLFWDPFIAPILEATGPKHHIVEVGASTGINTKNILSYCKRHDSRVTVIDPLEIGNASEIQDDLLQYGRHVRGLSLDCLDLIEPGTCYLIDGDHNYYTVLNECRKILNNSKNKNRPFPLLFFHDIGWPYGRRDMYYDKKSIPVGFALDSGFGGVIPGVSELQEKAGLNLGQEQALHEGGQKNGVLTAVEDFIEENKNVLNFEFFNIPSFHGLGLLLVKDTFKTETHRKIREFLSLPGSVAQYLGLLESFRVQDIIGLLNERVRFLFMYEDLNHQLRSVHESLQKRTLSGFFKLLKSKVSPEKDSS